MGIMMVLGRRRMKRCVWGMSGWGDGGCGSGGKREDWDSVGIKSEKERHETVKGVSESRCWESFGMGWADYWGTGLGPSFVGTWWLPRPIIW